MGEAHCRGCSADARPGMSRAGSRLATYDVFMSYAHVDAARATPIVEALRVRGLRVWFDETEISDFESITRSISEGLARSMALVAFYSDAYPTRRPCQWELTAAFLAAQHEGDPRRRVLVINPESHATHIHPVELRDALFRRFPHEAGGVAGVAAIAESVRSALAALPGPLSDVRSTAQPPWYGGKGLGSNRFVGRVEALWRLHSSLSDYASTFSPRSGPYTGGALDPIPAAR